MVMERWSDGKIILEIAYFQNATQLTASPDVIFFRKPEAVKPYKS